MFSSQALKKSFTRTLVLLVVALTSYTSFTEASSDKRCTPELSQQAEILLPEASVDWSSLQKHQKSFSSCDDGALAEGYSEAVTNLFSKNWSQLDKFSVLAKKDVHFKRWALRHIDASASSIDLKKILINTETCINTSLTSNLCKEIKHAAESALSEAQQ